MERSAAYYFVFFSVFVMSTSSKPESFRFLTHLDGPLNGRHMGEGLKILFSHLVFIINTYMCIYIYFGGYWELNSGHHRGEVQTTILKLHPCFFSYEFKSIISNKVSWVWEMIIHGTWMKTLCQSYFIIAF